MNINWNYKYFKYLLRVARFHFKSDKTYRKKKFNKDFGVYPDWLNPQSFNEKILYRMINPTNEELFTRLADKLKSREYVREINHEILPVIYAVYDTAEDIKISCLPERFVLKCNHDSGSFVICKDRSGFDFQEAKRKLSYHLKMNMYYRTREWQYKKIKPYIFCEEYIDLHCMSYAGLTPAIFRMHCFNSDVLYIEVEFTDSDNTQYINIYDNEWNIQPVQLNRKPNTPVTIPKPEKVAEAIVVAESLSKNMDYCRVDLYITSTKIYFSEFTFSPKNGRETFFPAEWDARFGESWKLLRE